MAMASAEPALSEGLLEYYKLRVATSEAEIAELRARVDAWAPSHALLHTSKWALQKRDDEVRPTLLMRPAQRRAWSGHSCHRRPQRHRAMGSRVPACRPPPIRHVSTVGRRSAERAGFLERDTERGAREPAEAAGRERRVPRAGDRRPPPCPAPPRAHRAGDAGALLPDAAREMMMPRQSWLLMSA